MQIGNKLGTLRQKRGLSAIELAKTVGVSRQTIYAIEAGTYVPNTVVALRLARQLESTVEELFHLDEEPAAPDLRNEQVTLLPGSESAQPGQTVELCQVDKRLMASLPSPMPWYFPASDAVVDEKPAAGGKTNVRVFHASGTRMIRPSMRTRPPLPRPSTLVLAVPGLGPPPASNASTNEVAFGNSRASCAARQSVGTTSKPAPGNTTMPRCLARASCA